MKFVGIYDKIDRVGFSEYPNVFGRKLYQYRKKIVDPNTITLFPSDNDWPMPRTYVQSFGPTAREFTLEFFKHLKKIRSSFWAYNKCK